MSFCKDCVSGVTHEGTPTGKWELVGGVNSYVATPTVDYPKNKVILFLADIFGPQLPNAQLMVDDFAKNGFKVVAPDYFFGDPAPANAMSDPKSGFDLAKWFPNHTVEKSRVPIDRVIGALRQTGVEVIGATGYCFGARFVFNLAFEGAIHASVVSHPSLLQVPADLETYLAVSKAPLLINSCTVDEQFPLESSAKADAILGGGKFAPGYKREYFDGCTHGFAVRGDISVPAVKAGKEGSFKATVEWFMKYL